MVADRGQFVARLVMPQAVQPCANCCVVAGRWVRTVAPLERWWPTAGNAPSRRCCFDWSSAAAREEGDKGWSLAGQWTRTAARCWAWSSRMVAPLAGVVVRRWRMERRSCSGRARALAPCNFSFVAAAGRPLLRRVSDDVVTAGKHVEISASRFVRVFNLPTDGLIDLLEVPNDLVLQARTLFSRSAGSFDAVTHERFLMMTAIHFGIKVNWRKILFEVLKEMVDRTTKRAKGFAAQICVILKGDPAVTLGEVKTFPPSKIISVKTVNTYVATNKTIDARGEIDEPDVATVAIVKKKSVSKKRPVTVSEAAVVKKKRTSSGKAVSKEKGLAIVSAALDAEPIQTVGPTPAMPVVHPPAPKLKAPKRKLRLTAGSDDESVAKEQSVEDAVLQ
ncbi:hypothetical protein F511_21812 [Dorcoceras hygrometricum]|uniref:Uncharacterized protein n=1 Tax=Dorcoceras hygrometricum TaxID=472368 RepID=A0A2Z7C867_9LAMI|nr:hypothetical protein F511_21812 [Dorcoceras hygrometricum]